MINWLISFLTFIQVFIQQTKILSIGKSLNHIVIKLLIITSKTSFFFGFNVHAYSTNKKIYQ